MQKLQMSFRTLHWPDYRASCAFQTVGRYYGNKVGRHIDSLHAKLSPARTIPLIRQISPVYPSGLAAARISTSRDGFTPLSRPTLVNTPGSLCFRVPCNYLRTCGIRCLAIRRNFFIIKNGVSFSERRRNDTTNAAQTYHQFIWTLKKLILPSMI